MVDVPDLGSGFCRFKSGHGQKKLSSLGETVDAAALKVVLLEGTSSILVASKPFFAL
jgi:hypothetical protein